MIQADLFPPRVTQIGSAVIEAGFRYELERRWGRQPPLLWIMLNPSTADARNDDPTLRRVISFSKSFGFGGAVVVNLFAARSSNPAELLHLEDPVGPRNDESISRHVLKARRAELFLNRRVVCAWGVVERRLRWRLAEVTPLLGGAVLVCLGTARSGDPRHPLYVRGDRPLVPFTLR